jgi:catechol 2,3-dioxygenase-like lactoylglutathione lyase family enzyme
MKIELDHTIVPARDADAAARQLAELLDVPWGRAAAGPFTAVYLNDGLTLDFISTDEAFPVYHLCFRVDDASFDTLVGRLKAAGVPYRGEVRGPDDGRIGTYGGGRNVYWDVPEGHRWELLTLSYARLPQRGTAAT